MKNLIAVTATIFTALLLTACDDSVSNLGEVHDEHAEYAEFIEHIEEHFEDESSPAVVPTDAKETAPDISEEHTCYTATATSTEGWLSYTVTLEGEETEADRSLFFDNGAVVAELFAADGTEIHGHEADLDEVTTAYIKVGYIFHELKAGTYAVKLEGLTANAPVKLVMAHGGDDAEGHDEDEHGHEEEH